jgi:uncharacterized membrane protein
MDLRAACVPSLLGAIALCVAGTACADPIYTITNLGNLGGTGAVATAINSSGTTIVGYGTTDYSTTAASSVGNLFSSLAYSGQANGVNNVGEIVGSTYTTFGSQAMMTEGNTTLSLAGLVSGQSSWATAVNGSGLIVGARSISTIKRSR